MSSDYDNKLLYQAILHYKAGEMEPAARYLERALDMADDYDTRLWGNYYASLLTKDPLKKRKYLENTLAIDPNHPEARKALAILDGKLRPDDIVNPDALPAQSNDPRAAKADRFTCPKCGGRMSFSPDGRTLVCEYCSRNQAVSGELQQNEQDFVLAMATGKGHRKPVAMQTFHCKGCGADFLLPPTHKTATCAYCGSAYVIEGESRELIEPDSIIPMGIQEAEAIRSMRDWAVRNKIKPEGRAKKPRGLYLPVWTFDLSGSVPWNGVMYSDKRTVPVSGIEMILVNDVPVPATRRLGKQLNKFLEGYNFQMVAAYDASYLAGWAAEVHEVAMGDASLEARQKAIESAKKLVNMKQPGVSDLSYKSSNIATSSFRLVLIPLWMTEYTLGGETYHVLVNGATGMVYGEKPAVGIVGWLESLMG